MHAQSGGRNTYSGSFLKVCCLLACTGNPQRRAPIDNLALVHCTFHQGLAIPPAVDVSTPRSTFNLQHCSNSRSSPLLQLVAAPLGKSALIPHCLTITSPTLYASLPPPEAATPQQSPLLRVAPRPGGTTDYNLALLYGLKQELSTTPYSPCRRVCSSTYL